MEEKWEKFEQVDLREGTFPEGSAWRPVGKFVKSVTTLRKDSVQVPDNLEPGNYVLGWRWDAADISQVSVYSFHDQGQGHTGGYQHSSGYSRNLSFNGLKQREIELEEGSYDDQSYDIMMIIHCHLA